MAKLNNERVDAIYKKLSLVDRLAQANGILSAETQKIVHIEGACNPCLRSSKALRRRGRTTISARSSVDLQTEFSFLDTLQE